MTPLRRFCGVLFFPRLSDETTATMRHPRLFRIADWWIHFLGPMCLDVRRPTWLNRMQMWAGMPRWIDEHR